MKGHAMSEARRRRGSLFVRRDANLDDEVLDASFVGGMRYGYIGGVNWTYPMVTLDIYESGLELRSTFSVLRFLVPVWRARYDEISTVHWLGSPTPDSSAVIGLTIVRGVRLATTDGNYVIFWCHQRNQVLDALTRHGLKIEAERKRFSFLNPDV
jgi:hypothetical protein